MNLDENLGMDSTNVKTFQTRRYTADGEGTVSSVVATLLMGMISGAFFGILASVAGYYGFYLVIIVPLLIGAGIGGVMSQGVQITKNRDPWVTAAAALSASLVAITTIHVCDYFSFLNEREQTVSERDIKDALSIKNQTRPLSGRAHRMIANEEPSYVASLQVETFAEYMFWQAQQGVSIGRAGPPGDSGMNLGFWGTIIYWVAEAAVIAFIAASMVWGSSSQPFCRSCDRWCDAKVLGELAVDAARVANILESGNLNGLQTQVADANQTSLKLFRCKQCGSPDLSVLAVEQITWYNGQRQVKCMGRFVVSDEAIYYLASVLNQASEELAVLSALDELNSEIRLCTSPEMATPVNVATETDPEVSEYMARLLEKQDENAGQSSTT